MASDENKRRILEAAGELIFRHGYNRVTVDEIARSVGMSKKTIYLHFSGKYDILKGLVHKLQADLIKEIDEVLNNSSLGFIDKLRQVLSVISGRFANIDRSFTDDIQRNVPEIWKEWNEFRQEIAHNHFIKLLEEGIRAGFVKPGLNVNMSVYLYMSALNSLLDHHFLRQLPKSVHNVLPTNMTEMFNSIINIIFEGILTYKARESLNSTSY